MGGREQKDLISILEEKIVRLGLIQNPFVLVPGGTSTFREFPKRRNERRLVS